MFKDLICQSVHTKCRSYLPVLEKRRDLCILKVYMRLFDQYVLICTNL